MLTPPRQLLFDWGDTLMRDLPGMSGPMWAWPRVEAMPGAAAALTRIAVRYPCHIASNASASCAADIRQALARVGLAGSFTHYFCRRDLGFGKPEPAFFRHAAAQCGCRLDELLMVGDALATDVQGAMACGLQAVWLNSAGLPTPTGVRAIASLAELPPLLGC